MILTQVWHFYSIPQYAECFKTVCAAEGVNLKLVPTRVGSVSGGSSDVGNLISIIIINKVQTTSATYRTISIPYRQKFRFKETKFEELGPLYT
jgi:hypothetical protein